MVQVPPEVKEYIDGRNTKIKELEGRVQELLQLVEYRNEQLAKAAKPIQFPHTQRVLITQAFATGIAFGFGFLVASVGFWILAFIALASLRANF